MDKPTHEVQTTDRVPSHTLCASHSGCEAPVFCASCPLPLLLLLLTRFAHAASLTGVGVMSSMLGTPAALAACTMAAKLDLNSSTGTDKAPLQPAGTRTKL